MFDLKNKIILVTGGGGFLGSHIVDALKGRGVKEKNIFIPRAAEYDLTKREAVDKMFADAKPQVIFHAAANVGGIGWNALYPADIFRDNLLMGVNILDASAKNNLEKLVVIGSACAYPGDLEGFFQEKDFLKGPLHPSVEVYGFSKRALYLGAKACKKQYGLKSVHVIPTNMYGPRDKFGEKDSHVVAAMVRRFVDAANKNTAEEVCWGTGKPVREFLFIEDAAEAILRMAERIDSPEPINMGTGIGTSIKELTDLTVKLTGYKGKISWDPSKPDGAMWKVLDISNMKAKLDWTPQTSLEEGLKKTIAWYRESQR